MNILMVIAEHYNKKETKDIVLMPTRTTEAQCIHPIKIEDIFNINDNSTSAHILWKNIQKVKLRPAFVLGELVYVGDCDRCGRIYFSYDKN